MSLFVTLIDDQTHLINEGFAGEAPIMREIILAEAGSGRLRGIVLTSTG